MRRSFSFIAATMAICITALAPIASAAPPQPAKPVDLGRYAGRWYEIAHLRNKIEADCASATADYTHDANGRVTAVETCRPVAPNAPSKVLRASVKVLDPGVNAKLRLTFFPFVFRDYWVLDHADDYGWAILATSNGRFLWLFARKAQVAESERTLVIARARSLGFDTSKLILDR